MRPTDHLPSKFEQEFSRYWKLVSEGREFECDLEKEWFYIKSMNEFMDGGRTNMKRMEMIDKMLNNKNDKNDILELIYIK